MKQKKTDTQAREYLYSLWENGEIPSNFTDDHSEYERAVKCIIKYGYLIREDFF